MHCCMTQSRRVQSLFLTVSRPLLLSDHLVHPQLAFLLLLRRHCLVRLLVAVEVVEYSMMLLCLSLLRLRMQ